jgi:hypothetical protein
MPTSSGTSAGSAVGGSGMTTTGPSDGGAMNGVVPSGSELPLTVAEPALIAATIGIDAVPASRPTMNR